MIFYLQKLSIYSTQYGLKGVVAESWIKSEGLTRTTERTLFRTMFSSPTQELAQIRLISLQCIYLSTTYIVCCRLVEYN